MNNSKSLNGTRIGVLGKGGAGKSTVTVILAQAFRQRGYQVCVIDADSTNFGLAQALGMDAPAKTLLDLYGGMIFSGGMVTCPVDDPTPLANADIILEEQPQQYYARNESGIVLLTAGKIGAQGPGAGCDGPIAKIARDLVVHTKDDELITLVDFKAGFEDSARGVLTGLDWAIVTVDPTIASVEIAVEMRDMIDQIKADVLPATAHLETTELITLANKLFTDSKIKDVFFILNKIPDKETEIYLRDKLTQKDIEPIASIPEDSSIPGAWLRGTQLQTENLFDEALKIVEKLEKSADNNL